MAKAKAVVGGLVEGVGVGCWGRVGLEWGDYMYLQLCNRFLVKKRPFLSCNYLFLRYV